MNLDRVPITIGHSLLSGYSYTIEWSYSVFASRHLPWTSETKKGFKTPEDATHAAKERLANLQKKVEEEEAGQKAQVKEMRETWTIETWLEGDIWSYNADQMWGEEEHLEGDGYHTRQTALKFAKRAIDQVMTRGSSRETETYRWEES